MNKKFTSVALLMIAAVATAITLSFCKPQPKTSSENLNVTAILPLTGPLSHLGENEKIGMTLALEDAAKKNEQRISFSFDDSAGKGPTAATIVQKRIDIDKQRLFVVATTGPVLAALPIFDDLSDGKLVLAQTMYPGITRGHPFAFRIFPSSEQEATLLAEHAIRVGHRNVAALHIQNEWGTESVNAFGAALAKAGGKLTSKEVYTFADKDYRTVLNKLLQGNPDAILIYAYPDHFPVIMRQFSEIGRPKPILANADFAIGTIITEIPADVLATTVFPAPAYLYPEQNPSIKAFNERVRAAGYEPNFDIATFYDMTMILNQAVSKAPSKDPTDIAKAMKDVFPYDGVTGHMELNEDREIMVDFILSRWVNGNLEPVK